VDYWWSPFLFLRQADQVVVPKSDLVSEQIIGEGMMRSIVNLAILALLSLGIFTSTSNLLNPPELVEAPGNPVENDSDSMMDSATPVPYNIDSEITGGWQTILDENFSGSWPWSGWTVIDLKLDNKIIY
jgi:hypothetical protein